MGGFSFSFNTKQHGKDDEQIDISSLPHVMMSTSVLLDRADSEAAILDYFYPYCNKVIPIHPGDEWYRPAIWIDSSWRIKMRRWVEVHWTSIWTHQDIPVLSTYMRWHYQTSSLWILIALLLKSYSYRDVESCIFRSWREQFVYLEMIRDSHTHQLLLVPSILQVRRIWPSRCRWWSGRDGSTLHQPIEVDGLSYSGSFSYPWDY